MNCMKWLLNRLVLCRACKKLVRGPNFCNYCKAEL